MEVFSNIHIDFYGSSFKRMMFCHLVPLVLECFENKYDEHYYSFEFTEGGNRISIDSDPETMMADSDIVDHGIDISNIIASVFPSSRFVYYADLDYTNNGGGWNVVLVKYDGESMEVFGPERRGMDVGDLFQIDEEDDYDFEYDEEATAHKLLPELENGIRSRIAAGEYALPVKYFQDVFGNSYSNIIEALTEWFPSMAIEYIKTPYRVSADWKRGFTRSLWGEKKEMEPKTLMLQSMEAVLLGGKTISGSSEYFECLPKEIITDIIEHCDGKQYPLSMKALREEHNRRA